MIIIKCKKYAEQFDEINDWFSDNTVQQLTNYEKNDIEVIDYDALERGEVPVSDENFENVLVDNLVDEYGEEKEEPIVDEVPVEDLARDEPYVGTEEEQEIEETPLAEESVIDPEEDAKQHFGSDVLGAMKWASENNRVAQIFYNTEGRKRGRGGKEYLKRELNLPKIDEGGVNINRIVEPHYIFYARKTKRNILVTYDRSVRYIRAFIVNNITDYNFTKNRTTGEDQYFTPRDRVNRGSDKRTNNMENINENLTEVAAEIEIKGMVKSAAIVKGAMQVLDDLKTAQYVGSQGYWLRNRRCWDNCYRQKRTTSPDTPAQEVWMDCWDEYKKSINDDKSGWEKYATEDKAIKLSEKEEKKWNKLFASKVEARVKEGKTTPEAIYSTIEEESKIHIDRVVDSSAKLMTLAETLKDNGLDELGEKLANISAEMLKEAGLGNLFRGVGKGIKNLWRGEQEPEEEPEEPDMKQKLFDFSQKVRQLAQKIRKNIRYNPTKTTSNNSIIIEAKKVDKEAQIDQGRSPIDWRAKSPAQSAEELATERAKNQQAANAMAQEEAQASELAASDKAAEELESMKPQIPTPSSVNPDVINTIHEVNSLAYEADDLASWISRSFDPNDPEASIAQTAIRNLMQSAQDVRRHTATGDINNNSVAMELENMASGATAAMGIMAPPVSAVPTASQEPASLQESPYGPADSPFDRSTVNAPAFTPQSSKYSLTGDKMRDLNMVLTPENVAMLNYMGDIVDSARAIKQGK